MKNSSPSETADAGGPRAGGDLRAAGDARAVVVLCAVQFVDVLGVTELITALPKILTSLPAPASAAPLLLTGYAMCFGGLLVFGSRLGDRYGHRPTLIAGIIAFAAGSLVAATAGSDGPLIAGRCLQGAAAAISVPAALRLLTAATPRAADRRRALSMWSGAGAAAGASGYLLGGAVTQLAGWRTMFWLNLPIAVLMAIGVLRYAGRPPRSGTRRLDLPGAVLFTAAVMGVVLAGSQLQQPGHLTTGLLIIVTAGALLAALVRLERRTVDRLIPTAALRHPRLRIGAAAAFVNTATTSPAIAIATIQLQRVQRLAPAAAGLRLVPFSLCVIVGSSLAAAALRRRSPPTVIALGLTAIAAGDALLSGLGQPLLWLDVGIAGAGIGLSSVAATSLGTSVPESIQGAAAGVLNTAAQLGTALGVAGVLLLVSVTARSHLPLDGPRLGWAATATLAAVGAASIALLGTRTAQVSDPCGEDLSLDVHPRE